MPADKAKEEEQRMPVIINLRRQITFSVLETFWYDLRVPLEICFKNVRLLSYW